MTFFKLVPALIGSLLLGIPDPSMAQSTRWDEVMSNSDWYVPAANLLAYITPKTDLSDTTAVGDQTIWALGTTTNGVFTGTSNATLQIGGLQINSTSDMNGLITDAGQVRIAFSSATTPTTIGIGQVRDVDGETYIQMQMMTTAGSESASLFVTHWAYMAKADGNPPLEGPALLSPQWNWMPGTTWDFSGWQLDGGDSAGTFLVDDYVNGYFWGSGSTDLGAFSFIGSATPEGNILFNTLSGSTVTSLTGLITGDASNGQMAVRSYYTDDSFGTLGYAGVIPEPGTVWLLTMVGLGMVCFRRGRRSSPNLRFA